MKRGNTFFEVVLGVAILLCILHFASCSCTSSPKLTEAEKLDKAYIEAIANHGIETANIKDFLSICKHDAAMQYNIKALWHIIPSSIKSSYDSDYSKTMLIIADYALMLYAKQANESKLIGCLTADSPFANALFKFFRQKGEYNIVGFNSEYDKQKSVLSIVLSLDYGDGHLEDSILETAYSKDTSKKAQDWINAHVQEVANNAEFRRIVLNAVKISEIAEKK